MGGGRQAACPDGRGGIQASGTGIDLPQVRIRFVRGTAAGGCQVAGGPCLPSCTSQTISAEQTKALEDRDYYASANVFWVPPVARWETLRNQAKQPEIGRLLDDALVAIEDANPSLKNILDKRFARTQIEPSRLGQLIDLISKIGFTSEDKAKDVLGEVYEYFLGQFATAEGKKGGQFYTPGSVVRVLVAMLSPHKGRIYDPCCGSGGMFVQSEKFIEAHGGRSDDVSIYGQESNPTTWRLVTSTVRAKRDLELWDGLRCWHARSAQERLRVASKYLRTSIPFLLCVESGLLGGLPRVDLPCPSHSLNSFSSSSIVGRVPFSFSGSAAAS